MTTRTRHSPDPSWQDLQLTARGRRFLLVGGALLLVALFSLLRACSSDESTTATPVPPVSVASSPSSATPPAQTSPAAAMSASPAQASAPASAATSPQDSDEAQREGADTRGLVHTGLLGKGTWQVVKLDIPPARRTDRVRRYVLRVEDGTGIDPRGAAREVAGILNDERGWLGQQDGSFELVSDPTRAEFTISLASPGRTQKMCPLDVKFTWSCRAGTNVILNTDRWLHMTPTYHDLTTYRIYMVNHEVGHFIGKGHVGCPGAGLKAPVMMQQSKELGGCRPNPWPSEDGT